MDTAHALPKSRRRSRQDRTGTRGRMEQLWAPWRLAYVQEAGAADGCVFCREAAGELGAESLVVHRGEQALVLLNKFPYSSGHLMVAPMRHIPALGEMEADESAEIHTLTVQAIAAL